MSQRRPTQNRTCELTYTTNLCYFDARCTLHVHTIVECTNCPLNDEKGTG